MSCVRRQRLASRRPARHLSGADLRDTGDRVVRAGETGGRLRNASVAGMAWRYCMPSRHERKLAKDSRREGNGGLMCVVGERHHRARPERAAGAGEHDWPDVLVQAVLAEQAKRSSGRSL